ncbi:MAG: hypothetical protein NTY01_25430 [Verrucomicrobia bacterium]|nr:hypothetical protein [Verrucomicrobiota bacterium]
MAKIVGRSTTRVKELAAELQLPDIRAGTVRIFLPEHVEKIRAEVLRREREALK